MLSVAGQMFLLLPVFLTLVHVSGGQTPGFTWVSLGSCSSYTYGFSTYLARYSSAKTECAQQDGTFSLASLDEDFRYVQEYISQNYASSIFWVDATGSPGDRSSFFWGNGERVKDEYWAIDEPESDESHARLREDSGQILLSGTSSPFFFFNFICQGIPNPSLPVTETFILDCKSAAETTVKSVAVSTVQKAEPATSSTQPTTTLQETTATSEVTTTDTDAPTTVSEATATTQQVTTSPLTPATTTEAPTNTNQASTTAQDVSTSVPAVPTTDANAPVTTQDIPTTAREEPTTQQEPTTARETPTTKTEQTSVAASVTTNSAFVPPTPCCICINAGSTSTPTKTSAQIQKEVQKIQEELTVEKGNLSATIRRKKSAKDSRPSAQATGYMGLGLLVAIAAFLLLTDIKALICG